MQLNINKPKQQHTFGRGWCHASYTKEPLFSLNWALGGQSTHKVLLQKQSPFTQLFALRSSTSTCEWIRHENKTKKKRERDKKEQDSLSRECINYDIQKLIPNVFLKSMDISSNYTFTYTQPHKQRPSQRAKCNSCTRANSSPFSRTQNKRTQISLKQTMRSAESQSRSCKHNLSGLPLIHQSIWAAREGTERLTQL